MMKHAIDFIHRFLQGNRVEPDEVLWAILISAFVFASLHLVTMFLTRWGDRRVTGKALLFSLLLHFGLLMAVVTIPVAPGIPGGGPQDPNGKDNEHRVVIHSISDSAEREGRDAKTAGKAAVWDRLPPTELAKTLAPKPQEPGATKQSIDRIEEHQQAPDLKTPDLASLPEMQQTPPALARAEAARLKRPVQTPEIETPKMASSSKSASRVPTLPQRSVAGKASAELNVERQKIESGNSPHYREAGIADVVSTLPSAPNPQPVTSPRDPAAATASDSGRLKASPAPIAGMTPETTPVPTQNSPTSGGSPSGAHDPVGARLPEGRWLAHVNRLPSGTIGFGSPGAAPMSPPSGSDQSVGAQPPAPQIQSSGGVPLLVRRSAGIAPTYRLRKLSNRKSNARQFGGSDQSERAVEASLRFLASVQERNGSWNAKSFGAGQVKVDENGVDRDYAGRDADSGVTALSILAFLGAGYTHEEGQYADNVDRALRWLVSQQRPDGNLGYGAGHFAAMYCHGMATYAIAEAYGMQNDPTANTILRDPLLRAVRYILDNQNPDGGWRYIKGQKSDISMFGWQLMALKSAEIAGVTIPHDAKTKMVGFLRLRSLGDHGGLAAYREEESPTASMTAEALFCKQMLGMRRDNAASQEAAEYILTRLPRRSQFNEYYWYYGTVAMYQYGGTGWQTWNEAIRDILISEQLTTGQFAGSWEPVSPWAKYGGRIYATALSTLCLEVYYRFLPLYQIGSAAKD
jgi:Squalene-hopene cyclase C-terminal domain